MPVQIFRLLKKRAQGFAYNSAVYNWSLRGDVPERLLVKPADSWPGDADNGRMLCDGQMPGHYGFDDVQSFVWLRDLRAYSHIQGSPVLLIRAQARCMIHSWVEQNTRWHEASWAPGICGTRIAMWISAYEFFTENSVRFAETYDDFEDVFFESLVLQARHLSRVFTHDAFQGVKPLEIFKACKGLLYAGLAFEGYEDWVDQALERLEVEIDAQIAGDGSHKSRSPAQLMEALQILLDVRVALSAGGYPLPEKIQHAIDRMGPALRFFRYNDKGLAIFHGTQEGNPELLDMILTQASVRGKNLQSLPSAGFERASLGRMSVMMDCGPSDAVRVNRRFDIGVHAAPLAFEMNYGRERVFVNCGTHPVSDEWADALRATPAHNALMLAARNACEIRDDGTFSRRAEKCTSRREDIKGAVLLESSHDGYQRLNGVIHRRRLYLCDDGQDLRGEETLHTQIVPTKPLDIALRFHLHPRVMVSLIRDGQEALLRLPGGTGWRFSFSAGQMRLEDSVYLGEGFELRKTKQLAIYGQTLERKSKIKWSLVKEGA